MKRYRIELVEVPRKKKRGKIYFKVSIDNQFFNSITATKMALELVPNQKVTVSISPKDRKNKDVNVDGVVFSSDNEEVVTVEQDSTNKLQATIFSHGKGVAKVTVSVDADLDEDEERFLTDFIAVEVKPEEATALGSIKVGEVTDVVPENNEPTDGGELPVEEPTTPEIPQEEPVIDEPVEPSEPIIIPEPEQPISDPTDATEEPESTPVEPKQPIDTTVPVEPETPSEPISEPSETPVEVVDTPVESTPVVPAEDVIPSSIPREDQLP